MKIETSRPLNEVIANATSDKPDFYPGYWRDTLLANLLVDAQAGSQEQRDVNDYLASALGAALSKRAGETNGKSHSLAVREAADEVMALCDRDDTPTQILMSGYAVIGKLTESDQPAIPDFGKRQYTLYTRLYGRGFELLEFPKKEGIGSLRPAIGLDHKLKAGPLAATDPNFIEPNTLKQYAEALPRMQM